MPLELINPPPKMNTKKLIDILTLLISMTACNQTREKKTKTEYIEGWKPLIENNYSISYPDD